MRWSEISQQGADMLGPTLLADGVIKPKKTVGPEQAQTQALGRQTKQIKIKRKELAAQAAQQRNNAAQSELSKARSQP